MCLPPDDAAEHSVDEVVAEVRRVRDSHAAKFNYNLSEIVKDFQRQERESGVKTVRRKPRPPRSSSEAA